ncbi:MAG: bifunctional serine/threonine-protein kinase/formylglycine-generating enzyme family protein [Lysobacterales bacterium]
MTDQDSDLPRIPGYAVESALGSGGMATVYRGRQLALDRPVAIKVLRAVGRDAPELNQRFEQEAQLIAALDHPNIVAIFEVTRTEDGSACYIMPLLAHGDLESRPRPMPEDEVKRILTAVLSALGHAHAKGVVHRDVKPANVLFDGRGNPLLADFGVALKVKSNHRLTTHGRTVGSSLTMSPEQARGEVVDGRSDLYSVGCLAYQLLTGHAPFDADDFLAVALRHQQDPIPRLPPALAHWQAFFDSALAKRPEHRYADAETMAQALSQLHPPSVPARPKPRRALLPAISIIAVLVLLVAIAAWVSSRPQAPLADAAAPAQAGPGAAQAAILAAIERGHWFDGAADSADALLAPMFLQEPVDSGALDLRDTLLDRASADLINSDDARLIERLPRWAALVSSSHADALPPVQSVVSALETRFRPALENARTARDRAEAGSQLSLAQMLPAPSAEFAELVQLVARFPARGEPFRDGPGPELLLIPAGRLASFASPIAVSRFEITRADYLRFAEATGRKAASCRDNGRALSWRDPGFPQSGNDPVVCVSFDDARAYAAWMSEQAGRVYRLPTLQEWRELSAAARAGDCANLRGENAACGDRYRNTAPGGQFAAAPEWPLDLAGNVREWTASCEFKEIGKVRQALGNFGRFLQGKERDSSGRVCVGRYVTGSGWRDSSIEGPTSSEDEDNAAPDRGFRLLREIK